MTGIRQWWNSISGSSGMARARTHVQSGGHILRTGGESLVVGGLLGAMDAKLKGGLDQPLGKAGADGKQHHVPLDAALGVAAAVASIAMAHEEVGTEARNIAGTALSVFAYRKGKEFVAAKEAAKAAAGGKATAQVAAGGATANLSAGTGGATAHGEDPIIAAARALGG